MDPRAYFRTLTDVLGAAEVTDRAGAPVPLDEAYARAIRWVAELRGGPGKMFVVGNGGSAAIAGHLNTDLNQSVGVRAMVFDSIPSVTALTNDFGYPEVYARPLRRWAEPGDVLLAISSSGQSENILRAARTGTERGLRVLTFSGFEADNPLRRCGELNFYVPSSAYGFVELSHSILGHALTDGATEAVKEASR